MDLLGLRRDTDSWLVNMERSHRPDRNGAHGTGRPTGVFMLQPEHVTSVLAAFSEKVHTWYPIFSSTEFTESFYKSINGLDGSGTHTCLAMLVMAIGSLVRRAPPLTTGLDERPDTQYFDRAISLLPDIMADYSLVGLQCQILFSLYYLCLVRPCQAHDYILMASSRAQNMLKSRLYSSDTHHLEALYRASWAIILIESELAVQLNFADSGIWKYDDHLPLPTADETWHFGSPATAPSPDPSQQSPQSSQTDKSDSAEVLSYFMAEIAMRRMLRRCTTSVSDWAGGRPQYAPIIADELELQLDQWYKYLPPSLHFHRQPTSAADVPELPTAQFLQAQYAACKASIYWPAVCQAIDLGCGDESQLQYCSKFFDAYVSFLVAAEASLSTCIPNTWTLYASIFIITLASLKGTKCSCLATIVNPKTFECFRRARSVFVEIREFSLSLSAMSEILEDRIEAS
ncbi:uncharacterized protein DNG_07757 [Cephalotrichum gorgonifer]|uniref:Xylanolytic transcriptional activator regulatory domain-containing protein n=1 Tax=Cephalotrichum gorgonifer TaxID=2041049 RepID=A0AAE8SYI7_9PEZI|nr:uncharacterized protein DNG_07757 [Cephalotrichum gorgonifer]